MDIQAKVIELNNKVKELNKQRQQNIGRREVLNQRIKTALDQYNTTYGTSITEADVDIELKRVQEEMTKEIEQLSGVIGAIEAGDINLAYKLSGTDSSRDSTANMGVVKHEEELATEPESTKKVEVTKEVEVQSPVQSVSPKNNPVNIDDGTVQGIPAPKELGGGGSIFSRNFAKQDEDDEDSSVGLAPPPSFDSILGGNL